MDGFVSYLFVLDSNPAPLLSNYVILGKLLKLSTSVSVSIKESKIKA